MSKLRQIVITGLMLIDLFSLISCASKPKTIFKRNDFAGLVVDENNQPVEGMIINFQKSGASSTYITNENGMFFIPNVKVGNFHIKGDKTDYSRFEEDLYFSENKKVYCWQIKSIDSVLDTVSRFVSTEQYDQCLPLLQEVSIDKRSDYYQLQKKLIKELKLKIKVMKNEK